MVVLSASNVWAVGDYANSTTLIKHWNGTWWLIATSPNPALRAVAAVATG